MKDFNKTKGRPQTSPRQALDLHLDMLPLVQNMVGDSV